jgi:hypothetical protein
VTGLYTLLGGTTLAAAWVNNLAAVLVACVFVLAAIGLGRRA